MRLKHEFGVSAVCHALTAAGAWGAAHHEPFVGVLVMAAGVLAGSGQLKRLHLEHRDELVEALKGEPPCTHVEASQSSPRPR